MVASALLGLVVMAVISAVSTAQQLSFEGQKRILAAMAADDLMSELVTLPYAELRAKDALREAPGTMKTLDGTPYPPTFWALGRIVSVREQLITDTGLGVTVRGLRVVVSADDEFATLATVETFIPEPPQ